MKKKNIILAILIALILLFGIAIASNAQIKVTEISEKHYTNITSGNLFYEGRVQLIDGIWYNGWIARFPDSNTIKFRPQEDSLQVLILKGKYINAFAYQLKDSIPYFVFKDIPVKYKKSQKIAVELLTGGEINLYVYKSVRKVEYYNSFLQKKYEYQMWYDFYLEKDNKLYVVDDLKNDLGKLIKDKEEVYVEYKDMWSRKNRKNRNDYIKFINGVNLYNETE